MRRPTSSPSFTRSACSRRRPNGAHGERQAGRLRGDEREGGARLRGLLGRPRARGAAVAQAVHARRSTNRTRRSTTGSTTASSTPRTTASTATSRTATPTRPRSSSRPTTARSRSVTYQELYQRVCKLANGAEVARRAQGRSRDHLHADVGRRRRRDAGVRAHRRDALGRVRRLLGEVAAGAHRRCRRGRDHHRRRAGARRQGAAAQGRSSTRRSRMGGCEAVEERRRLPAHRQRRAHESRPRPRGCTSSSRRRPTRASPSG